MTCECNYSDQGDGLKRHPVRGCSEHDLPDSLRALIAEWREGVPFCRNGAGCGLCHGFNDAADQLEALLEREG